MARTNTSPPGTRPPGTRSRIRTATGVHQAVTSDPDIVEASATAIRFNTTPVVEAIGRLELRGIVIPHSWFKHIRTPSGAPNPLAVMILSDIVHYYKPTEKYDAETGHLTVHKKFRGQKLQRRNSEYVRMFGYSKSQVLRAVHQLVDLDLVTQEIVEQMMVDDVVYNNVQYLEPVPRRVAEITHYASELETHLKLQRKTRESGRPIAQLRRDTTPVVDAIERINLTGNVLPPLWFQHIKTDAGAPYPLAVMILGELIYWYRPDIKRDPDTLATIEINKRFEGEKYRMRNTSYADYLGVSHDQVYRAIHRLADLGLITQETARDEGNVQYVEPVPERIEQITFEPASEVESASNIEGEGRAEVGRGGLRADAPGLRVHAPPLRADAPGLRVHEPPLRADAPGLTRPRTTNTKTSDTRTSTKISTRTSSTAVNADDDIRARRAAALQHLNEIEQPVFEQLEALLNHYQIDGLNRIDLAHRLTHRAGQIDGTGEWQPMAYRIINGWRKCLNLYKAGKVGDASGFTGFFVYKLRGMDTEYLAQADEMDEGRMQWGRADSVALARQIEGVLEPSQQSPAAAKGKRNTKGVLLDATPGTRSNGSVNALDNPAPRPMETHDTSRLTQQPPGQEDRAAFAAVKQSLLDDEGLKHLAPWLVHIELIACDGVQFVVAARGLVEREFSPATLEIILAHRLQRGRTSEAKAVDVRVVDQASSRVDSKAGSKAGRFNKD